MAQSRPWKVRYHYDGTFTSDGVDTTRPINGCSAHHGLDQARVMARRVSVLGGTSSVIYRDPVTREETVLRAYAACEVAPEDL
ncbi:MAG: hypothetical protein LC749_12355 [Actinobacteria bacterium]|nr:hypothetical protein [Actinomycetota bacterium]